MRWKWLLYLTGWELGWFVVQLIRRGSSFAAAQAAAKVAGKPLLVVGNPHGQYPCGDVTLDLERSTECPTQQQASVENILYPDKYFGAAFVSHVLEHTCDPQKALSELHRVADQVFVEYPYPWRLVTYLIPGHAWIVTGSKTNPTFRPWHQGNCNVKGYFGVKP